MCLHGSCLSLFYQNLIHNRLSTDQNKIIDAYQFFERKLQLTGTDIQLLKKVISNNLSVVSIVLDIEDDPYLVFESLNAKGRSLTQADLIRNYFFMKIHVNEQESIHAQYWEPMQIALGDSLTECIRHYLMKDGKLIKQTDVYFFIKDIINKGDVIERLKELARFAGYYQKFLSPEKESNTRIQQALKRIHRLEVTTAYPFLLNCYDEYQHNRINEDEFFAVLKIIENFIIRRFICNISTNALNKIFPSLFSQIKSKISDKFVEGLSIVLQTKGYPKDPEFKSSLINAKLYGAGDHKTKAKLILEAIEESYRHKETVHFGTLTIEHLMPQTLTQYWKNQLGEDAEATHELLLHTIGNLTLTAYNPELSNSTWEKKKEILKVSHLELNSSRFAHFARQLARLRVDWCHERI